MYYTEANVIEEKGLTPIKLFTLGLGLSGEITSKFRWGISAQNLKNQGFDEINPLVMRLGVGVLPLEQLQLTSDLVQRDVLREGEIYKTQAIFTGIRYGIGNVMDISAGYGAPVSGPIKKSFSAGLGLLINKWTIAYQISKPDMALNTYQEMITLSVKAREL